MSTDTGALTETLARDFAPTHWPILLERHRDRLRAKADAVLALPALRDLIAEHDRAVAAIGRIAGELDDLAKSRDPADRLIVRALRRALDGTP